MWEWKKNEKENEKKEQNQKTKKRNKKSALPCEQAIWAISCCCKFLLFCFSFFFYFLLFTISFFLILLFAFVSNLVGSKPFFCWEWVAFWEIALAKNGSQEYPIMRINSFHSLVWKWSQIFSQIREIWYYMVKKYFTFISAKWKTS